MTSRLCSGRTAHRDQSVTMNDFPLTLKVLALKYILGQAKNPQLSPISTHITRRPGCFWDSNSRRLVEIQDLFIRWADVFAATLLAWEQHSAEKTGIQISPWFGNCRPNTTEVITSTASSGSQLLNLEKNQNSYFLQLAFHFSIPLWVKFPLSKDSS